MEIKGGGDWIKQLRNLKSGVNSAELRSALRFAISPIKKEAEIKTPKGRRMHKTHKGRIVTPGFASRSWKLGTYKFTGGAGAAIRPKPEAWYIGLVGSGYRAHGGRGKKIKFSGYRVPGRLIMRPAVDKNRAAMSDRFGQQLVKRLKKRGAL